MTSTTEQGEAGRVCEVCFGVPWYDLCPEDTGAYPHHKSRKALEASAEKCPLCRLVLRAAISNYQTIDTKDGHWREWIKLTVEDETGAREMLCTRELGNHYPEHKSTDRAPFIFLAPIGQDFINGLGPANTRVPVIASTRDFHDRGPRREGDEDVPDVGNLSIEDHAVDLPVWIYGNYWRPSAPSEKDGGSPLVLVGIGARFGSSPKPTDAFKCKPGHLSLRGSAIRICTSDDSVVFRHVPGRLPEPRSDSEIAYKRLEAWLKNCVDSHPRCRATTRETVLPTRVIDVFASRDRAALVKSRGRTGKYIALSHTWGKSRRLTATKRTVGDLMEGIAVSSLPKTFRDAIDITRRLGIRYLWIDCLCIIQDDPQDWEREAAAMTRVYRNSYLTISASASSDSHSGCFPTRTGKSFVSPATRSLGYETPTVHNAPALYTIGYEDRSRPGRADHIYLYEEWLPGSLSPTPQKTHIGSFGKVIDPVADQPLSTRGWTLQERLLSPRVVHYAGDQIYFECETEIRSECGFKFPNVNFDLQHCLSTQCIPFEEHGIQNGAGISFIPGRPSGARGSPRQQGGWLSLVEDYSRRQLSVSDDKLSAIAGVARIISEETGDYYIAGVWANHLMEDIFWRVYTHEETFEDDGHRWKRRPVKGQLLGLASRPPQYRAPSWSWASIDAPVKYIPLSYRNLLAQPRHCYTTPSGADRYGRVCDGFMDIEGPIFEVKPYQPRTPWDRHGLPAAINLDDERGECIGEVHADLPDTPMEFPCYALFIDPANALIIRSKRDEEHTDAQTGTRRTAPRRILCTTDLAREMRKPPRGSTILWVGGDENHPDPAKREARPVQVTREAFNTVTANFAQQVSLVNEVNHVVRVGVGTFFKDSSYEGRRPINAEDTNFSFNYDDIRRVEGDESWGVITRDDASIPVQIR